MERARVCISVVRVLDCIDCDHAMSARGKVLYGIEIDSFKSVNRHGGKGKKETAKAIGKNGLAVFPS